MRFDSSSRWDARRAFTLIELLVVIAIIGVLIGLLLPAVQKVREAANRAKCANAMKNIGLAIHAYHDTFNCFPPGYQKVATGSDRANWIILMLPYIEQGNLFNTYVSTTSPGGGGSNSQLNNSQVKFFQCPSAPDNGLQISPPYPPGNTTYNVPPFAMGNYVANQGVGPDTCCKAPITNSSGQTYVVSPGVFLLQLQGAPGATIPGITDGTSTTMMISEVLNNKGDTSNTKYAPGGTADFRGVLTFAQNSLFNTNYTPNSPSPDQLRTYLCTTSPVAPCIPMGTGYMNHHDIVTPRSMHTGGVQVGMCDGSVRFVSNNISLATWQAAGSPNNGDLLGSDW